MSLQRHRRLFPVALAIVALLASCGDDPAPSTVLDGTNNGASNNGEDASDHDATNNGEPDAADDASNNGGPDADADLPDAEEDAPIDTDVDPCDTFALVDPNPAVLTLYSATIAVTGGTGDVGFTLLESPSGAILDPDTGYYLAGPLGGVSDLVRVEDRGCNQTLEAHIDVIEPLTVRPDEPDANPSQHVCFDTVGGSEHFTWALLQKGSGSDSALDTDGCYTAGSSRGEDVLLVTDTRTGQQVEVRINVTPDPHALIASAPRLMLPEGETFPLEVTGGSGAYTFAVTTDAAHLTLDPERPEEAFELLAESPGDATVTVTDAFYEGVTLRIPVDVLSNVHHDVVRWGTHSDEGEVVDLGDINNDGYPDLGVSVRAGSLRGPHAGSLFIYLGSPTGPGPAPAQTIDGIERYKYLGRGLTAGDFNHDGCSDVAVGIWGDDRAGGDAGAVEIWTGCNADPLHEPLHPSLLDNGVPDPEVPPLALWRVITGEAAGVRAGWTVVSGDFDGDNSRDLAIASPRVSGDDAAFAGRITIYLNHEGLDEEPSITIDGKALDDTLAASPLANMELGWHMATGRVNADACDDLLVGSSTALSSHGYASLYLSTPDATTAGGCLLAPRQAVGIVADDLDLRRAGRLGWRVALGDLDGDCRDDVIVSQINAAAAARGSTNAGAVNVFFADPDWTPDAPVRLSRLQAGLVLEGDDWDQLGSDVAVGDLDHNGTADLIVGVRSAEHDGTAPDIGEVRIYPGLISGVGCVGRTNPSDPVVDTHHLLLNRADRNGDLFGQRLTMVSDLDGDGARDLVLFNDRGAAGDPADLQDQLGELLWFSGGTLDPTLDAAHVLTMLIPPSEDLFGYAVENVGDLNADGYADFVVGAPYWDRPEVRDTYTVIHAYAGAAWVYFGGPDGLRPRPDMILKDHADHTASDQFGYDVSTAGDVNGDGFGDLVVSARLEDATSAAGSYCRDCRPGGATRSDIGALYVYLGGPDFGARYDGDAAGTPINSSPDYVVCGPPTNSSAIGYRVGGGFDIDGDGHDDLSFSNYGWNSSRGRAWFTSTAALSAATPVLCFDEEDANPADGALLLVGENASDLVGYQLASADLNGDGCDDLLVSAYNLDPPGFSNAGGVLAHLGWGKPGCPTGPIDVLLRGQLANENMGYGLAAADVDGDGIKDLAVASVGSGSSNLGVVYVYDGAAIRAALADVRADTTLALDDALRPRGLADPTGIANNNFGVSLASLGDLDGDGFEDLIVGSQLVAASPLYAGRTGAAYIFRGSDDDEELARVDVVVFGESRLQGDGRFGWDVAGGPIGIGADVDPTTPSSILVGAPWSEWDGPAAGQLGAFFLGNASFP